ncbi:hypothetical protein HYT92_02880, partial [Candidatus Pacearchaeota archaeon]|nr:hypothetical protein [Candidatus Pacearchaeota archaeon]
MTGVLGIVKEGKLIPEELWIRLVDSLENDFDSLETNNERAKRRIAGAIISSIKKRTAPKFGVLFSGGVDSSLIAFACRQLKCNFTCYTVGIEGSDDIEWAQKAVKEYGFNFKHKILNINEFENVVKDVVRILNDYDIVKVSV